MELGFENGGGESEPQVNLPWGNVPQQYIPVRGGAQQFPTAPVPAVCGGGGQRKGEEEGGEERVGVKLQFIWWLIPNLVLFIRVPPIPNFIDTTDSDTGICVLDRYRYHVHHVLDIHLNSGSGVVKCIWLSALQPWAIVSYFLLRVANSSILPCACSFSIWWRAIYCSGCFVNRYLQRLLVLQLSASWNAFITKLAMSFISIHREMLLNLNLHSPGHQSLEENVSSLYSPTSFSKHFPLQRFHTFEHAGLTWYDNSVLQ